MCKRETNTHTHSLPDSPRALRAPAPTGSSHVTVLCMGAASSWVHRPSEPQGPFTGGPLSPTALAPGRYTFLCESLSTRKLDWKNHTPPLGGQSILGASLPRSVQLGPARNSGTDGFPGSHSSQEWGSGTPQRQVCSTRHRLGP